MFSQNSSIAEAFNYPETNKQIAFVNGQSQQKYKRKHKQPMNPYELQQQQKAQPKNNNKLYFKIQVIKKVGTFLQNLKAGIVFSRHNLKATQLNYLQSQTKQNQIQKLIPYENIGIILLEALIFIILWINIWQNSYQIIFSELFDYPYIQIVTLFMYLCYIYFFLNTQIKNEKLQLISNRQIILEYYINQRMAYDAFIVGTLILQITPLDDIGPLFIIFRISTIMAFKPISDIAKKLQNIISISTDAQIILSILSLFFKIFILLHCLSLVLTTLSNVQKSRGIQITWIQGNNLNVTTDLEQYIVGWYWGATVLSTVGFGEITPVNHIQRFFISFIQIMCCVMFGFFVNYIGSLINMVGQSKKIYQKDMRRLNRYLLKQYLPDNLKSNIRSHFFNKFKIDQVYDPGSEQTIMNKLTNHLTTQIIQTRNKRILSMSQFLKPFTDQTVKKLSLVAKKMVFAPEQIIFSQKSKDFKLWIIQDGIVQQLPTFFNPKQDKAITMYDKDNEKTIGWINFLTQRPYKTTARTKTFTLSYQIKKQDFYKIMRQNQFDYNKMLQLKQTLIQKRVQFIMKCLSCQRYSHNVLKCPRIHFVPKRTFNKYNLKQQIIAGNNLKKRKSITRSKVRFNWKKFQGFSQYTPQIEGIVIKHNLRTQIDEQISRRCSVQSFVHTLYRNKSSQQDKNSDKMSSDAIQQIASKKISKIQHSQLILQVPDTPSQRIPITNIIDNVFLGQQGNGYMESHIFNQVSKRYMLYMINYCANKNNKNRI